MTATPYAQRPAVVSYGSAPRGWFDVNFWGPI